MKDLETCKTSKRWAELESLKGTLHQKCKDFAKYTIPYLYPEVHDSNLVPQDTPIYDDLDSTGARAVNHLSNRVISTLFPDYRPFLRLEVSDEVKAQFIQAGVNQTEVDTILLNVEKSCIKQLTDMGHKPVATLAVKYLIVTGNALLYYNKNSKVQCYNTRNFCITRDISGNPIEILTVDTKNINTFAQNIKDAIVSSKGYLEQVKKSGDEINVSLYTHSILTDTGKWTVRQQVFDIDIIKPLTYNKKDFPFVPLAWTLLRGENYGRGMIEEYAGTFEAVSVLSRCMIEGVISSASVKYLVDPSSVVNVEELNKSRNGSYHTGRTTDISAIVSNKHNDLNHVQIVLESYQRQLSQVFLLNTGVTRSAERVTAEEIRMQVQELETAFGGIYSRFTEEWQKPLADKLIQYQDISIGDKIIYPIIVTGLETLTRAADTDNYRAFMLDISMLAQIPEVFQQYIKPNQLLAWLGNNRGVDYTKFIKTEQEVMQEQQQALAIQQEQEQQQLAAQSQAQVAQSLANGG